MFYSDKFHREAFARSGESRWSFENVFPLKFLHIDQTYILLKYLYKFTIYFIPVYKKLQKPYLGLNFERNFPDLYTRKVPSSTLGGNKMVFFQLITAHNSSNKINPENTDNIFAMYESKKLSMSCCS